MAETRGITIEFYGKSVSLENTIEDINKGLRATRSELSDVKKQLKLDPGNLDKITQQMKILRQEQALLGEKANYFRNELSKMDKDDIGSAKWVKYTSEVNKAETSIQAINKQLDQLETASMGNLPQEVEKTGKSFENASDSALKLGDIIKGNIISEAIISGVKALASAVKDMAGDLHEWAEGYREVEVYEKQFESNLKNTADASDEQIASLKKLAKQKERTGVTSAKAITSAYQELATYVESADAIEGLTDALVDMSAQQYGVDASADSVRNLATTLGKALANGDYSGLTRLGYGFTEAQQKIMKYGTELERVAVLNDVISSSIGGMNEALAQTDAGQLFQAQQYLDDVKNSIGEIVSEIEVDFVQTVLPALQPLIDDVLKWIVDNKDNIASGFQEMATWLGSDEMKQAYRDIGQMVVDFGAILTDLKTILEDSGLLPGAWDLFKITLEGVRDIVHAIAEDIAKIKSGGLGDWMMGNYNSYYPGTFESGGYQSGGMMSGSITLNNTFSISSQNVTESMVRSWADIITEQVNENLGRMV